MTIRFTSFPIKLRGMGTFGDILWAGIEGGEALTDTVRKLRKSLGIKGIPFDPKKFRAHITLVRKASNTSNVLDIISPFPSYEMTADRISLMRSDRYRRGMVYTEIGHVSPEN